MKNLYLIVIITFISINVVFTQNPDNHWQLGVTDVNFGTNPPAISTISNAGNYGRASISDSSGNLLFYTDGSKVWNKNHTTMTNGDFIGNPPSVFENRQSAVIVPHPGNSNQFYIFTSTIDSNLCTGTCYSQMVYYKYCIVDFGDQLFPLGKVISREDLYTNENSNLGALTVVRNSTNNGYFVVSGDGTKMRSYSITTAGLNTLPVDTFFLNNVIYDVERFAEEYQFLSNNSSVIRISPDNSVLGQLILTEKFHIGPNIKSSKSHFFTLNFDNSTGVFSNFTSIVENTLSTGGFVDFEFSMDSEKVYFVKDGIFVKDLLNPNAAIRNLFETTLNSAVNGFSHIQKDKFGNILLSSNSSIANRNNFLHKINNQNSFVNSTIDLNFIFLNNNTLGSKPYLPQLINNIPVVIQTYPCGNTNLDIITNVSVGTDTRQATTIRAFNVISSGAIALYHAEDSVTLLDGFTATSGSVFRGYIEGCSGIFSQRTQKSENAFNNQIITANKLFSVYPNPNNGRFTLHFQKSKLFNNDEIIYLEILDYTGKIMSKDFYELTDYYERVIDVSSLKSGLYIIKATVGNIHENLKFIKN